MPKRTKKSQDFADLPDTEKKAMVQRLLDQDVAPMLAMDGGGISLTEIRDWTVRMRYDGHCVGCPIGFMGTRDFIEQSLKMKLDPRIVLEIEDTGIQSDHEFAQGY